jgi:hypothetical protein
MATASILRIGPSENSLSANVLTKALISYFHQNSSIDESDAANTTAVTATINTESCLRLQNKYFTANVLLKDIDNQLDDDDNNNNNNKASTAITKEDGIILVFDALQSNPDRAPTDGDRFITFDSLSATHEQAERNDTCGDLLRLCVGVSWGEYSPEELRGSKNAEKEYSRRILWCLDRGYEYVEADLSPEGQAKGHHQRDKDGFARIVEAIQGTMWSSAVVDSNRSNELKTSYRNDMAALKHTTVSNSEEKEETKETIYQPPNPSLLPPWSNNNQNTPSNSEETHDEVASAGVSTLVDPTMVETSDIMAQLREDLEAEKLFDKMEGLLKEASQIRAASKDGTMSDNERRERAGEAALALVNLMGQFGMEDDEEFLEDSDDSVVDCN